MIHARTSGGAGIVRTGQLFLSRLRGAGVLAAMVSSDVFAHEVQNATFGHEVRIVAPGGKQQITLEG